MKKYPGIPELLEQYMLEQGADEQWVTVQELRDRFGLTRYQCNTVSGFLRRLEFATFGRFPYIVARIEHTGGVHPSDPPKSRYLVKRKDTATGAVPGLMHHTGIRAGARQAAANPDRSPDMLISRALTGQTIQR